MWNNYTSPVFKEKSLYKHTRHPLYLGFIIAFWAAPTMTVGHLVFTIMTTAYILLAIETWPGGTRQPESSSEPIMPLRDR